MNTIIKLGMDAGNGAYKLNGAEASWNSSHRSLRTADRKS